MKFFYLTLFILVLSESASGQKTRNEGYIITNVGDTIRGLFSAARWNTSPDHVGFESKGVKKKYKPLDIKSFYVANEFYESAIVNVDHSVANTQNLDYSSTPQFKQDTLFLRVLFRGSKILYHYKNKSGWVYFFSSDGSNPIEQLVYKRYLVDRLQLSSTKTFAAENRTYIGQLKTLFKQCPDLTSSIESVMYNQRDLEKLFAKFSRCSGEEITTEQDVKNFRVDLFGMVGVNQPFLKFRSDFPAYNALVKGDFEAAKVSPSLGAGLEFKSLRRDNLSFRLFLLYSNLNVQGNHFDEVTNTESNFTFRHHWIGGNLNLGLKPFRTIPLNLAVGGMPVFISTSDANWQVIYPSTPPRQREFVSSKFKFGATASISYQVKKLNFELMFERNAGISGNAQLASPLTRIHFLVKYSLFGKME